MKKLIESIQRKIDEDLRTQKIYETEVTQDFASVNAEIRLRAFREVLALIAARELSLPQEE